jgi:hypothetical protein
MSLSRYQLERTDLTVMLEQGRRVEGDLYAENHRTMQTMGELLKARMFGATEYALSLRKRMTNYVQGDGVLRSGVAAHPSFSPPPEPHKFPCQDPYCDRCNEAIKRLFRDIGLLPSGKPDRLDLTDEPFSGRFRVPTRYRKDESDK